MRAGRRAAGPAAAAVIVPGHIGAAALGWGAAAGVAGTTGSYCLIRGYRTGRLAVVSPAASATASSLPILVDLGEGLRISTTAGAGVALAIVAVVLVGARPAPGNASTRDLERGATGSRNRPAGGLGWGLAAGIAHAAMYLLLARTPAAAGLWPVTALFIVLVALALAAAGAGRGAPVVPLVRDVPGLLAVGVFSAVGTVGFVLASRTGSVGVAAVTTELSPVVTAVLARLFLREQLPALRIAGLVLAVAATGLIGLG